MYRTCLEKNTSDVGHLRNTPGRVSETEIIIFPEWDVSEPLYALRVHLSRPPALLHRQHKQILDDYRQLARAVILSTLKTVLWIHEIFLLLFEGTFTSFFKDKKS
jgi:hypothetical protein